MRIKILLLFAALLFGCKDYNIKTTVSAGGECTRVISISPGSKDIFDNAFPVLIDESWDTTWTKNEENKSLFTARKQFKSIEEFNEHFAKTTPNKMRDSVIIEKKFRRFYTYFNYTEVLKAYNPFNTIPITDFVSDEVIEQYLSGNEDEAKEKLEKWQSLDILNYFLINFEKNCETLREEKLTHEFIFAKRDTLLALFDELPNDKSEIADYLAEIYGVPAISSLSDPIGNILTEIEEKLDWAGSLSGSYNFEVELPGIILSTNSEALEGNTARWKTDSEKFYAVDFVMTAESRVMNTWAMIATGILGVFLIILIILPVFRKK